MPFLNSPRAIWNGLYALAVAGFAGGAGLLGYSVFAMRAEKLEIIYRIEGVPFMAMPPAVPADKWERMSAVDLEILEPLADWSQRSALALLIISSTSMILLLRLWPHLQHANQPTFKPSLTGTADAG